MRKAELSENDRADDRGCDVRPCLAWRWAPGLAFRLGLEKLSNKLLCFQSHTPLVNTPLWGCNGDLHSESADRHMPRSSEEDEAAYEERPETENNEQSDSGGRRERR